MINFQRSDVDLQNGADYMGWGYQDSPGSNYYVKLIYYANNRKEKQGLHVGANTYVWGYLRFNESAGFYNYSDKSIKLWSDKDVSIGSSSSNLLYIYRYIFSDLQQQKY